MTKVMIKVMTYQEFCKFASKNLLSGIMQKKFPSSSRSFPLPPILSLDSAKPGSPGKGKEKTRKKLKQRENVKKGCFSAAERILKSLKSRIPNSFLVFGSLSVSNQLSYFIF